MVAAVDLILKAVGLPVSIRTAGWSLQAKNGPNTGLNLASTVVAPGVASSDATDTMLAATANTAIAILNDNIAYMATQVDIVTDITLAAYDMTAYAG